MDTPGIGAEEASGLVREAIGVHPGGVERVDVGFANQNWHVTATSGEAFVVKIGPLSSARKWESSRIASRLAADRGVPCPRLLHAGEHAGRLARIYERVDGNPLATILDDPERVERFCTELGSAVARLHTIDLEGFSSRLDGSAPTFATWAGYIDYRVEQVHQRCLVNGAPDSDTLERACTAITELAPTISRTARATLCHRDIHPDNLLVHADGGLAGILDWDTAEAWDQAGDWFKLDWLLFPAVPAGVDAFNSAYRATHPRLDQWTQRKRLVELIETLNTVANAAAQGWHDFGRKASRRLEALLADTRSN